MSELLNSSTPELLTKIKRSFRQMMNGVASHSMREKGLDYHLNWGVSFIDLKKMAEEYEKDLHLAIALWKENIRECKILATLLMPPEEMTADLAELWMEQTDSQEIAEMLAFNLFQYVEEAPEWAFKWIASGEIYRQITGYAILSRLLMNGRTPDVRGIHELIDQALTALDEEAMPVRHAAYTCLQRLSQVDDTFLTIVNAAVKHKGLAF